MEHTSSSGAPEEAETRGKWKGMVKNEKIK